MLFNSLGFLPFLAAALIVFYGLPYRFRRLVFLVSGYLFYSFWDWRFCLLLALTTLVDYHCALGIDRAREIGDRARANLFLGASLLLNLGLLFTFKYFNFFADSFANLMSTLGFQVSAPVIRVILPVGISFYTFQEMSYVIDVWRGTFKATRKFLDFANFVVFFPHLVAGPIVRAEHLLPQLAEPKNPTREMVREGLLLIFMGYVKKVVIGDQIAPMADYAFAHYPSLAAGELWLGALAFTLQIYFDFSGYSDIARGIARWFGVVIHMNFRRPFLQRSITATWAGWHISLSTWIRDYVYVSLGGNRKGYGRGLLNLVVSMTAAGIWHGASMTFVWFGLLHGLYLSFHRTWHAVVPPMRGFLGTVVAYLITQLVVVFTFVLFRAPDMTVATGYFKGMLDLSTGFAAPAFTMMALLYAILFLVDGPAEYWDDEFFLHRMPAGYRVSLYIIGFALVLGLMSTHDETARPFIYFQF